MAVGMIPQSCFQQAAETITDAAKRDAARVARNQWYGYVSHSVE